MNVQPVLCGGKTLLGGTRQPATPCCTSLFAYRARHLIPATCSQAYPAAGADAMGGLARIAGGIDGDSEARAGCGGPGHDRIKVYSQVATTIRGAAISLAPVVDRASAVRTAYDNRASSAAGCHRHTG